MIAMLTGIVEVAEDTRAIIDVQGVGYEVRTGSRLPEGEQIRLHIHAAYRDGEPTLYAFDSASDVQLLRGILKVPGLGPVSAAKLLHGQSAPGAAIAAIRAGDAATLASFARGIGKKKAQEIIEALREVELDGDADREILAAAEALRALGHKDIDMGVLHQLSGGNVGTQIVQLYLKQLTKISREKGG